MGKYVFQAEPNRAKLFTMQNCVSCLLYLVFDHLPDDSCHLVSIKLHNWLRYLDAVAGAICRRKYETLHNKSVLLSYLVLGHNYEWKPVCRDRLKSNYDDHAAISIT